MAGVSSPPAKESSARFPGSKLRRAYAPPPLNAHWLSWRSALIELLKLGYHWLVEPVCHHLSVGALNKPLLLNRK